MSWSMSRPAQWGKAPIIVEFRCAELYKGRRCGAPVGEITPSEIYRKSHPDDDGRDAKFCGLDWSHLTLEVSPPTRLHRPIGREDDRDEWAVGQTPAQLKDGTPPPLARQRVPDGDFAIFHVESARMGPGPHMPAYIECVCGRGRHRHLVIERDAIYGAVAEWKTTKKKVTRGVSARH